MFKFFFKIFILVGLSSTALAAHFDCNERLTYLINLDTFLNTSLIHKVNSSKHSLNIKVLEDVEPLKEISLKVKKLTKVEILKGRGNYSLKDKRLFANIFPNFHKQTNQLEVKKRIIFFNKYAERIAQEYSMITRIMDEINAIDLQGLSQTNLMTIEWILNRSSSAIKHITNEKDNYLNLNILEEIFRRKGKSNSTNFFYNVDFEQIQSLRHNREHKEELNYILKDLLHLKNDINTKNPNSISDIYIKLVNTSILKKRTFNKEIFNLLIRNKFKKDQSKEHQYFLNLLFRTIERNDISPIDLVQSIEKISQLKWNFDLSNQKDQLALIILSVIQLNNDLTIKEIKLLQDSLDQYSSIYLHLPKSNLTKVNMLRFIIEYKLKNYNIKHKTDIAEIIINSLQANEIKEIMKINHRSYGLLDYFTDAVIRYDNSEIITTGNYAKRIALKIKYNKINIDMTPLILSHFSLTSSISNTNSDKLMRMFRYLATEFKENRLSKELNTPYFVHRTIRTAILTKTNIEQVIELTSRARKILSNSSDFDITTGIEFILFEKTHEKIPSGLTRYIPQPKGKIESIENITNLELISSLDKLRSMPTQLDQLVLFQTTNNHKPFLKIR